MTLLRQALIVAPIATAAYMKDTMGVCIGLSLVAAMTLDSLIPTMASLLCGAGRIGKDLNKAKQSILPESMGIAAGAVYLATMFLFLPFPFMNWSRNWGSADAPIFPFQQVSFMCS